MSVVYRPSWDFLQLTIMRSFRTARWHSLVHFNASYECISPLCSSVGSCLSTAVYSQCKVTLVSLCVCCQIQVIAPSGAARKPHRCVLVTLCKVRVFSWHQLRSKLGFSLTANTLFERFYSNLLLISDDPLKTVKAIIHQKIRHHNLVPCWLVANSFL